LFITFEGIEGCGKTTQIERLAKMLDKHGIKYVRTLEPGGTEIGKKIRKILLDSNNKDLYPLTELILYIADRAQHVEQVIRPALVRKKWVICDRFFDATVVYQGFARGQDMELIRSLNEKATGGIRPDMTFLLDCPEDLGLARAIKRNEETSQYGQDRFERERMNFHRAVRSGYLELAANEDKRFVVIDASQAEDEVEQQILVALRPLLKV
jgi:dTMP kinase